MAALKTLRDVFLDEIRDLYDGEKQLTKALPKLAKAASSGDLRSTIEAHVEQTRNHVERLEQVFTMLSEQPAGKHCAGIAGIIDESSDLLRDDLDDAALDAAIIAGAQRAEHYEISAYGSLVAWAHTLGKPTVAELLNETLDEERFADEKLSALAEGGINDRAVAVHGDEDEEWNHRETSASVGSEGGVSDDHWSTRGERIAEKKGTFS